MKRLQHERERSGLSKERLGQLAKVNTTTIRLAEGRGLQLYPQQLVRLAAALGYEGDPAELLEDVS